MIFSLFLVPLTGFTINTNFFLLMLINHIAGKNMATLLILKIIPEHFGILAVCEIIID